MKPAVTTAASAPDANERRLRWGYLLGVMVPILMILGLAALEAPLCPTKMLFGLPCPGCGLTRATIALFTLDFPTMMAMHPLAPVIDPLLAIMLGRYLLIGAGVLSPASWDPLARIPKALWIVLVAALFVVWGLRLFGYLGGPADAIDPEHGWATRLLFAG